MVAVVIALYTQSYIVVPRRHRSATVLQGITKWFYLFYEFAVFGRMKEKQISLFALYKEETERKSEYSMTIKPLSH